LGSTGSTYESIQPVDFFDSIVESLHLSGMDFDLSKLNYREQKDGKIISFLITLDTMTFLNRDHKLEEIKFMMKFTTGFGGYSKSKIELFTLRLVCSNGMTIKDSQWSLSAKHTANKNAEVLISIKKLSEVVAQAQKTLLVFQELDKISVSREEIQKFKLDLLKIDDVAEMSTKKKNQLDRLSSAMDVELSRSGVSAYGLLQGATYYTNHLERSGDFDYLTVGTGLNLNNRAQELVMAMN
jgi:hypothetical protein